MRSLPHSSNMRWPDQPYNFLRRTFPELSDAGLRLLNALQGMRSLPHSVPPNMLPSWQVTYV
jgi:hypothetical protein